MKLTILNPQHESFFELEDFLGFVDLKDIKFMNIDSHESLDGKIFHQVPSDTTHLVTWFADRLGMEELLRLPKLQYVGLAYTGWWDKYFDHNLLRKRRIVVTNNPQYAQNAVAEAVIAALLLQFRKLTLLPLGNSHFEAPFGRELNGKRFGIIGLGRIGIRLSEIAQGIGMLPISTSTKNTPGVQQVSRKCFFETSDIITLHVPKAAGIVIGEKDFKLMSPQTTIINSSGYENIDIVALKSFLTRNSEASYLYLAKPTEKHFAELSHLPNSLLFPLFASRTEEAELLRKSVTIQNLRDFLAGKELDCRVI